jgi:hypothetical protein
MKRILVCMICLFALFWNSTLFAYIHIPETKDGMDYLSEGIDSMLANRRANAQIELQQRQDARAERLQAYQEEILELQIEKMRDERDQHHRKKNRNSKCR